jgi:hypothetical protein
LSEASRGETAVVSGHEQTISMLMILLATCKTTRDTLCAADNPVDAELLRILDLMIERSEAELLQLVNFVKPS